MSMVTRTWYSATNNWQKIRESKSRIPVALWQARVFSAKRGQLHVCPIFGDWNFLPEVPLCEGMEELGAVIVLAGDCGSLIVPGSLVTRRLSRLR